MSSGLNCDFVQVTSEKWYYLLEDWNAPKMAWDWRDYATAYGPFLTMDLAHEHLHHNHSNPGGHGITELPEWQTSIDLEKDQTLKRLIENAQPVRSSSASFYR
jgi:hypothetical protein